MKRFSTMTLASLTVLALGIVGYAGAVAAQMNSSEQACVNTFTNGVAQVSKTQGGIVRTCLKHFAAGSLVNTTPEACLLSDQRSKLTRAAGVANESDAVCSISPPGFGVSASTGAIVMAAGRDIELVRRTIGGDLNAALITQPAGARCQARVIDVLQKCTDTRMTEYNTCLRVGMATGTITDAATMDSTCLGGTNQTQPDPKGKIAKQCIIKVGKAVDKYCANADLNQAFPACHPTDADSLKNCLTRESACELCQVVNAVSGLSHDCDGFDDGNSADGTCGEECGDGILQPGEGCDDGNTGDGDGCAHDCKVEVGYVCNGQPSVCVPACGDGVVEADQGETCDDGNTTNGDGCSSTCTIESCGNGTLDSGETCDDSNHNNGDGCSNTCQTEPGYICSGQPSTCTFVCGNGTHEGSETCDDGNTNNGDGCSSVCKIESGYACSGVPSVCHPVCGDGLVRPGEGCDDGNVVNGDGCANSCQPETGYHCSGEPSVCTGICGDGLIRATETCDDHNTTNGDGCSSNCTPEAGWTCTGQPSICAPNCGNGHLDAGEQCDDGNAVNGDGCSHCTIDAGYACFGQPSVCGHTCGNGQVQGSLGEQCDDGNTNNGDGCSSGCMVEAGYACSGSPSSCSLTCGNGQIQGSLGEQCDDGNRVSGDGCNSNCKIEPLWACTGQPSHCFLTCGDGTVEANLGEQCDDGNTTSGDGCDGGCLTEPGYYCSGNPSVCQKFSITIDSPTHGTFTQAATVDISGHYTVLPAGQVSLLINGVAPNLSFNPETRSFTHRVTLSPSLIFNPVDATVISNSTGFDAHDRIVVIDAASVPNGSFSPESVALRLNESGLASVEPLVASLAGSGLNLAGLIPVNQPLADQCFIDLGFLGCWGRAKVVIANPPPSFGGLGLTTDARPNVIHGDITVKDMRIDIAIQGSGLVPNCGLRIKATSLSLGGDFALEPAAADPHHVDVNLVGSMGVNFVGFAHNFTYGICTWPIISDIINAVLPDLQSMATNAIGGFLNDPDGSGPQKSPVAEGIESALDGVDISGGVSQGVGLTFDAPMFEVAEDDSGMTIGADSRFTVSVGSGPGQCNPPPGTPHFSASYSTYSPFPTFGPNTSAGVPYGLGITISTAGFNQLLRGQTECGLMRTSLTTIDIDGPGGNPALPITSDLLSLFVPEFATLPAGTPLRIDLAPTLAPIVSGNDGPNGELADLRIAQMAVNIVQPSNGKVWLKGAFDARLGMDLAFAPDGSGLAIAINKPATTDVSVTVIDNPLGVDEHNVETVLPNIMAPMIPSLAGALSGFPLPAFFGLHIQGVDVSRNGQFLQLFANLVP